MLTRMLSMILRTHNELSYSIMNITRPRDIDAAAKLFFSHSVDEERLMREVSYDDLMAHQADHALVIDSLKSATIDESLPVVRDRLYSVVNKHMIRWDKPFIQSLNV